MRLFLAVIGLAALVAGCTPAKPRIVTKYEYVVVEPNPKVTEAIETAPPPNPEEYSVLSANDKEAVLFKWAETLMGQLGVANMRFKTIRADVEAANKIYGGKSQIAE